MKIRYSPRLVIGVFAFGGVVTLIGVVFVLLGQPAGGVPLLVAGMVGGLVGLLYTTTPYVLITKTSVVVTPTLPGRTISRLSPGDRLTLASGGSRLVVVRAGVRRESTHARRWAAHPGDWQALRAFCE